VLSCSFQSFAKIAISVWRYARISGFQGSYLDGYDFHYRSLPAAIGLDALTRPGCCSSPVPPHLVLSFGLPPGTSRKSGLF
jgi:hypothetical protein